VKREPLDEAGALEVACAAAQAGGEILLEHLGKLDPESIRTKSSSRDLVTIADLASEREIVGRLRATFPEHSIEAEEETKDQDDGDARPRWFIDPLDGTVNYVHGLPLFGVSIALYSRGEPVVAVVHVPRLAETFQARRGHGCFLGAARLSVSSAAALSESVLATGFPYRRNELPNDNLANFAGVFHSVRGLRRMGSAAIDLAFTAAGRLDGFWELHLSPHDVAAGALLVREAGGIVTDMDGGGDWLRGGHIVASGPHIHARLLERVSRR